MNRKVTVVGGAGNVGATVARAIADRGIVTSKLFDIVGLRTPMLVIAPPGSDVEAMVAGRESTACFPADQTEAIARWIAGVAAAGARPAATEVHSWRCRGKVLRRILEEAVRR